jgi:DNA repair protein RecO (recombination protein O)
VSQVSSRAILLRAHPYSETSQILRFYAQTMGVVAAVAKGVRKSGGRGIGALSTLGEGTLILYHRPSRELQTFKDFSLLRDRRGLARDPRRFAGASVLGELVLLHAGSEGNPMLYSLLADGLDTLEAVGEEGILTALLLETWTLIAELGYAPSLRQCVSCGRELEDEETGRLDFAEGGIRCSRCQAEIRGPRLGPLARKQLRGLVERSLEGELIRPVAHLRLASDFITYHISGGIPLRSMEVLGKLIPHDDA